MHAKVRSFVGPNAHFKVQWNCACPLLMSAKTSAFTLSKKGAQSVVRAFRMREKKVPSPFVSSSYGNVIVYNIFPIKISSKTDKILF